MSMTHDPQDGKQNLQTNEQRNGTGAEERAVSNAVARVGEDPIQKSDEVLQEEATALEQNAEEKSAANKSGKKRPKKRRDSETKKRRTRLFLRLAAVFCCALLILFLGFCLFIHFSAPKLSPTRFAELAQSLCILDQNGNVVSSLDGGEDRTLVDADTLPQQVKNAFIAAEDVRFYSHCGVDVRRMFGALLANVKSGDYAQGASTITQQLIKLTHLTPDKTLRRKLYEIDLALQAERRYEKDEILEMYLNTVYFGGGYYGIEAAAQGYFGCAAQDLSVAQAAALAAILKAPSAYAPHIDPEACRARRNLILDVMAQETLLSAQEAARLKAQNLTILPQQDESSDYGWYVDQALLEACACLNVSLSELYSGGYRIYTCMDSDLQAQCETIFSDESLYPRAPNGELSQCAAVVMDSRGGVRAVIGGRTYDAALCLNRATDCLRQPGSLMKPIAAYAPAIEENGYCAASVIVDEPIDIAGYRPSNYGGGYSGPMLLCDALAQSVNVPAVKLLHEVGVKTGFAYAGRAGLTLEEGDRTLSLALGGLTRGVTPLQMCAAYAALSAQGTYRAPHFVTRITYADGTLLWEHEDAPQYFVSSQTAFILSDMLRYTVQTGTAAELAAVQAPLAGKTGTVDYDGSGNRDIWAAAYNNRYSALVWMGMDETNDESYIPSSSTGGRNSARALAQIFTALYPQGGDDWFTPPEGVTEVRFEKTGSLLAQTPVFAGSYTPQADQISAYVTQDAPSFSAQSYWTPPQPPDDVRAALDSGGCVTVSFTMSDENAFYEIWRQSAQDEETCVATLDGTYQNASFRDVTAPTGVRLRYRVRGVHKQSGQSGSFSQEIQALRPQSGQIFSVPQEQR